MPWFEDVLALHRRQGLPVVSRPTWPDEATVQWWTHRLSDDLCSLTRALTTRDLPGVAGALAGVVQECVGTALACGIDLRVIWDELRRVDLAAVAGPPDLRGALARGRVTEEEGDE